MKDSRGFRARKFSSQDLKERESVLLIYDAHQTGIVEKILKFLEFILLTTRFE